MHLLQDQVQRARRYRLFNLHSSNRQLGQNQSNFYRKGSTLILANDTLSEIKIDIEILLKELSRKSEPNGHDLRNQYVKRKEKRSLLDQYKIYENMLNR